MKQPKELTYYMEKAEELLERDKDLRLMQAEMDRLVHLEYRLPPALEALQWMRRVVTTAPYDATYAAVRALSGLDERVKIDPISVLKGDMEPGSEEARVRANEIETALKWQIDQASRRRDNLRAKAIESALRYDEICAQVIHLPTQIKAIKKLGGDARRHEAALQNGQFVIGIRNPQNVRSIWSDYMLEGVLYHRVMNWKEITDFWGEKAAKIKRLVEDDKAGDNWVLYDYMDYDVRVVWAVPGDIDNAISASDDELVEIMREPWTYKFLPWSITVGATQLDYDPERQRRPLLYGIYQAEQWITTNIVRSLEASEAIAEAGRPDVKIIAPDPNSVEQEFAQPGGAYRLTLGQDVQDMAQRGLDPALRELGDRLEAAVASATLPRILVTAEVAPGETFSGYNLRVQQALASLIPFKRTGERWFEDVYRKMLLWTEATGKTLEGYGKNGEYYKVEPEDVKPDKLYLTVELTPDIPLDRQQRIASAIQMARELKYPAHKILEDLGETDPQGAIKDWAKEQLFFAEMSGVVQLIQAEASQAIQQMAQQMAQQMVQQAQQQAAAQQGPQGMMQGPTGMEAGPGPQGVEGVEGAAFNPAEGGAPPAGAYPPGTFEGQTGMTRGGNPLA